MFKKFVSSVKHLKRRRKKHDVDESPPKPEGNAAVAEEEGTPGTIRLTRKFTVNVEEAISEVADSDQNLSSGDFPEVQGSTVSQEALNKPIQATPEKPTLPFAADSVCGGRFSNEDAYSVVPNFIAFPLHALTCPPNCAGCASKKNCTAPTAAAPAGSNQTLQQPHRASNGTARDELVHFFGVFDGHGGSSAAEHCAEKMHTYLLELISSYASNAVASGTASGTGSDGTGAAKALNAESNAAGVNSQATAHPAGSIGHSQPHLDGRGPGGSSSWGDVSHVPPHDEERAAAIAEAEGGAELGAAGCKDDEGEKDQRRCCIHEALVKTFLKAHAEFVAGSKKSYVGSTAVTALVSDTNIWVANCGDSRAVMSRSGAAVPLSHDHKPTRADEAARVTAAGGHVWWDRVMGELAVSRAIGDDFLRPYVIANPEIVHERRTPEDEVIVMATDGLWDVFTNQEACDVALRQMRKGWADGYSNSRAAARCLIREALMRSTRDNVTVIVVDLKMMKAHIEGGQVSRGGCAVQAFM